MTEPTVSVPGLHGFVSVKQALASEQSQESGVHPERLVRTPLVTFPVVSTTGPGSSVGHGSWFMIPWRTSNRLVPGSTHRKSSAPKSGEAKHSLSMMAWITFGRVIHGTVRHFGSTGTSITWFALIGVLVIFFFGCGSFGPFFYPFGVGRKVFIVARGFRPVIFRYGDLEYP